MRTYDSRFETVQQSSAGASRSIKIEKIDGLRIRQHKEINQALTPEVLFLQTASH
jgi:hypothetical protein